MYDYVAGKLDWMAAGLPTSGSHARQLRAASVARKDAPICRLEERLGDVKKRVLARGWDSAVVVNDERVVLGIIREKEFARDADLRIEDAMRPGPSTFRPFVPLHELAHFMLEHRLENAPITTSDGRLVGLLLQQDALNALRQASESAC